MDDEFSGLTGPADSADNAGSRAPEVRVAVRVSDVTNVKLAVRRHAKSATYRRNVARASYITFLMNVLLLKYISPAATKREVFRIEKHFHIVNKSDMYACFF